MIELEKLLKWLNEYYEINGTPNLSEIKAQIEMGIESERQESAETTKQYDNKALHIADVIGCLIDFAVENNKLKNRDRVFLSINNDNTIIEVYEADINKENISYVGCYRINDP